MSTLLIVLLGGVGYALFVIGVARFCAINDRLGRIVDQVNYRDVVKPERPVLTAKPKESLPLAS